MNETVTFLFNGRKMILLVLCRGPALSVSLIVLVVFGAVTDAAEKGVIIDARVGDNFREIVDQLDKNKLKKTSLAISPPREKTWVFYELGGKYVIGLEYANSSQAVTRLVLIIQTTPLSKRSTWLNIERLEKDKERIKIQFAIKTPN